LSFTVPSMVHPLGTEVHAHNDRTTIRKTVICARKHVLFLIFLI
jgi:hypothetical protein